MGVLEFTHIFSILIFYMFLQRGLEDWGGVLRRIFDFWTQDFHFVEFKNPAFFGRVFISNLYHFKMVKPLNPKPRQRKVSWENPFRFHFLSHAPISHSLSENVLRKMLIQKKRNFTRQTKKKCQKIFYVLIKRENTLLLFFALNFISGFISIFRFFWCFFYIFMYLLFTYIYFVFMSKFLRYLFVYVFLFLLFLVRLSVLFMIFAYIIWRYSIRFFSFSQYYFRIFKIGLRR